MASEKLKTAVLISGRGSNLQALIDACAEDDFPAKIVRVISNKADAGGLARAAKAGIDTETVDHRDFADREAFEAELTRRLEAAEAEMICLAGFMRLLTKSFVDRWQDKVVNIHPSLLPAFKGLDTHQRVLDAGVRFSGCTVHFVRAEMDAGPILLQAVVPVMADDTEDSLAARVLRAEHKVYPAALRLLGEGRATVKGEVVTLAGTFATPPSLAHPLPVTRP